MAKSGDSRKAPHQSEEKKESKTNATIVAVIVALTPILVAIISSPIWLELLKRQSTPTPTPTIASTATETAIPATATDTSVPVATVPTDFSIPGVGILFGNLTASRTSGKAPLKVNFNASGSYLQYNSGDSMYCKIAHSCTFSWNIYLGETLIKAPFNTDTGNLTYTFSNRGDYVVVVTVCREGACDTEQVSIMVK